MKRDGDQVEVNAEEASGGTKNQGVRYVLAISLFLVIVVLSIAWMSRAYYAD